MKVSFIHTGDLHLGRQFHFKHNSDIFGRNRRTDCWNTFETILNMAEQNRIDLLLIAGDLFDSDEIDVNEMHRAADMIKKLSHTKVVILPGNHDYYSSISIYGLIDWPQNVTIFKNAKMDSIYFPDLETEIYGFAWQKNTYNEMPLKKDIVPLEERNNIMILHGDAYNKKSDYMPIDITDYHSFDYIALGHFHKPDFLTKNAAYCGSPEALDFGERGVHGIILGQIDRHHCAVKLIKIQKREYITQEIEIRPEMRMDDVKNDILTLSNATDRNKNFYRVILKGYCDLDLSVPWLYDELQPYYYYLELNDDQLQIDLDIDGILENNRNNIVGQFIHEMKNFGNDPVAKRALYFGLEGILNEGNKR